MENISTLILRRQLSMFGHVARLPVSDPVHRSGRCRLLLSRLKRIEGVLRGAGSDRSAAWELAKGSPDDYMALGRSAAK